MEAWQQIGVAITSVVMFLSGMLAGATATAARFRDGRWRLPKPIDWVDETLRAEAEVRALREALEDMLDWADNPPLGESTSFDDDMRDYESRQQRARRLLAPEPPEGA